MAAKVVGVTLKRIPLGNFVLRYFGVLSSWVVCASWGPVYGESILGRAEGFKV